MKVDGHPVCTSLKGAGSQVCIPVEAGGSYLCNLIRSITYLSRNFPIATSLGPLPAVKVAVTSLVAVSIT